MTETVNDTVYCSIDLELTGFDPTEDEIIEVGFVKFKLTSSGPQIVKEWSQVFRPAQTVHPKILGLTGLTETELAKAPPLAEYHDFLRQELSDAVLVGHHVEFDIKFLEAFGIPCRGSYLDTLDLAQFLLPTHHSYNLENLMHFFGVSHKEAHRALADSQAVVIILEKLLAIFAGFSPELQQQMREVMQRGSLPWQEAFSVLPVPQAAPNHSQPVEIADTAVVPLTTGTIINFPFRYQRNLLALGSLQAAKKPALLAVPDQQTVLELYRHGLAEGLFLPADTFNEKKFGQLLRQPILSPEATKFVLKILVWRHTNWQHRTILDLNLSFFGGQFRAYISGGKPEESQANIVCCAYETFLWLSENRRYGDRLVLVADLQQFEHAIVGRIQSRISWRYLGSILHQIYNPQTNTGSQALRDTIVSLLAAGDLFFGLVMVQLRAYSAATNIIGEKELLGDDYRYNLIRQAAVNFSDKLLLANKKLQSRELEIFSHRLKNYFEPDQEQVRWIEYGEYSCVFISQPVDIHHQVSAAIHPYPEIVFTNASPEPELLSYWQKRSGLESFSVQDATMPVGHKARALVQTAPPDQEILKMLSPDNLPAVICWNDLARIKEFYTNYFRQLKQYAAVLTQGYSGGLNKLFRNFGIQPSSILMVTDRFFLRSRVGVEPKTMILEPPRPAPGHPYLQALQQRWQNEFPDLPGLLARNDFYEIITRVYGEKLETVHVIASASELKSWENKLVNLPFLSLN